MAEVEKDEENRIREDKSHGGCCCEGSQMGLKGVKGLTMVRQRLLLRSRTEMKRLAVMGWKATNNMEHF